MHVCDGTEEDEGERKARAVGRAFTGVDSPSLQVSAVSVLVSQSRLFHSEVFSSSAAACSRREALVTEATVLELSLSKRFIPSACDALESPKKLLDCSRRRPSVNQLRSSRATRQRAERRVKMRNTPTHVPIQHIASRARYSAQLSYKQREGSRAQRAGEQVIFPISTCSVLAATMSWSCGSALSVMHFV